MSQLVSAQCFTWNGEAMEPVRPKAADARYVVGQRYWLEEMSERSWASHAHQFAWIAKAWENLPAPIDRKFPTPEHLRKAALIATGWHSERIIHTDNPQAARDAAAVVKFLDAFAYVRLSGSTVTIRTARSQRTRGEGRMSKAEFQQSKDAVLGWIADLIGVSPEELGRAA